MKIQVTYRMLGLLLVIGIGIGVLLALTLSAKSSLIEVSDGPGVESAVTGDAFQVRPGELSGDSGK